MRTRICVAVLAAAALFLSGCGSAKRPLSDSEASLLTNGNTTLQFHTSAYHPSGISLGFPGYVMAIDKSPVERVAHNRDEIKLIEIPDAGLGVKVRSSFLNSSIKTFYIAQINEYTGRPYGDGNCTTYNLYYQISRRLNAPQADPGLNPENTANYVAPFTAFVPWCNGEGLPKLKEGLDKDPEKYAANYNWRDWPTANVLEESPYTSSWAALEELRDALAAKLSAPGADYTHIVVVVMGWNTVQTEAYRNFNSLMTNIRANAKKDPGVPYNPLFIGVTWPSSWESGWAEPLVKLLSYPFKAGDADEVGLSWLAALFQEVVFPLKEQHRHLKVVAIGHSFGATSLGLALYVGPVIERNDSEK